MESSIVIPEFVDADVGPRGSLEHLSQAEIGKLLDTSKGGRRQWCIAELCGNKNRLRRFHAARG